MDVETTQVLNKTKLICLIIVLSAHNDKSILFELIQFYVQLILNDCMLSLSLVAIYILLQKLIYQRVVL